MHLEVCFEILHPLAIRINDHLTDLLMRMWPNASPGAIDTGRKVKHILLTSFVAAGKRWSGNRR